MPGSWSSLSRAHHHRALTMAHFEIVVKLVLVVVGHVAGGHVAHVAGFVGGVGDDVDVDVVDVVAEGDGDESDKESVVDADGVG
jgi:hypothetical protein